MTVVELKRYINSENKIEYVLEQLGCHSVRHHPNYISAGNPDGGDNKNAITVYKNDNLNAKNYTRNIGDNIDLIDIIIYFNKCDFKSAIKWLHKILDLKFTHSNNVNRSLKEENKKPDPLEIFKKIKRRNRFNVLNIEPIEHDVPEFTPHIHIGWYHEGIMTPTVRKFGLGYSYKHKRNVVPLRYWATGELIGFTQRTVIENYEMFDIPKYFITPNYPKQMNVFGLWENYDEIQKAGCIIVFESEKSVLKRDSLLDYTAVALSGNEISDEQVRILIGLNVNIVIALDNDVPLKKVYETCEKFYQIRNVYYIHDKYDLLGAKDSPADARNQIYQFLLKHKVKYGEKEHQEYLRMKGRS